MPAIVEFVDIAGLVAGEHGRGLATSFSHTSATDAIINGALLDDPNVIHVAGRVDPIADIEVIQTSCAYDLGTVGEEPAALHQGR